MSKCVIVLEDDRDLAQLVCELLVDADYHPVHVTTVERLLEEAARRSPCAALVDSTNPRHFDQWSLGPRLNALGVPPVAFTAHTSAQTEFEADAHGFAGIVSKPFDAEEFLSVVNSICLEDNRAAVS